jgi:hypothetical protein
MELLGSESWITNSILVNCIGAFEDELKQCEMS